MKFLLNRRVAISMLFISLTLLGYMSYKQLPLELFPNAELPTLSVTVNAPQNMDPAYVESEAIIPIEGAISSIGGVERIESNVSGGRSTIRIEFANHVNIKTTSLRLEEKMKEVSAKLPEGFTVRVQRGADMTSMASSNFMTLQVRGKGGVDYVRNVTDEKIATELQNIDGVAAVNVFGGREKAIEVRLDLEACKALNLTPSRIATTLGNQAQERIFVGNVKEGDTQFFVHVSSTYNKVSDIENIVVAPGPILLKDIAIVYFDLKEETSYSRVNGMESVRINLMYDAQTNMIDLAKRTIRVIDNLNERLLGLEVEIVIDANQAEIMENNLNQIVDLALVGGLLAVFVLWFFLKNFRLVVTIALSIPLSVFIAFNLFYATGLSLNSLTLVGLALAIGMLLDNSVVVLENIYRLSSSGMPSDRSVLQGTTEVWRSIVAATLTTVTVFLPFLFTDIFGLKLLGSSIGVSVVSTLVVSMAVALLFVPMMAYTLLRAKNSKNMFYEKVSIDQRPVQIYLVLLKTCMRRPGVTIFGAVTLLIVSFMLANTLNLQMSKEPDVDRFGINITMRTGSTLQSTDKLVRMLEERIAEAEIPELKDVSCSVYAEQASLTLVMKEDYKKISRRGMSEIQADVQTLLPRVDNAQITVTGASGGGSQSSLMGGGTASLMRMMGIGSNQERILIKGSDYDLMLIVAEDIRYIMENQDFIRSAWVSYQSRQPEVRLNFDQILLNSYNISSGNIETGLREMSNEYSSNVRFKVGEEYYEIMIRDNPQTEDETDEDEDEDEEAEVELKKPQTNQIPIEKLQTVQVANASGGLQNLTDIASITKSWGRSRITRVNQDKQMYIGYSFTRDIEGSKTLLEGYRSDIDEMIVTYNPPNGIAIEVIHQESEMGEFQFLILAAVILIFIILACVFESVSTPFIILFCVPLAAIGALLALLLTGNTNLLNANVLTGFLILLGVVINNGIILIDYSNILRARGYRRERALIMAGLSRVRPILITSVTTVIAMLPLAMGDTEYSGLIGAPFAITVIGGLSFSTLLTLVVIPTVAVALENTMAWYRTLAMKTKLIHLAIVLFGVFGIYLYADGLLQQITYFIALIAIVPGATYFAQTSLRRAKADVIDKEKDIHIIVESIVKIYDREGEFSRQWKSGSELRRRLGIASEYRSLKDFIGLSWQIAVWGFAIYFTYFYLTNKTWVFLFTFPVYAATIYLWRAIREYLFYRFKGSKIVRYINRFIFWGLPALFMFLLYKKIEDIPFIFIVGFLWAAGIVIYLTSQHLYVNNVNIERITGRFASFKRSFFRFVKKVPIIGKRRRPFKALRSISFEIKTGMFGLLGPNGAGKSTFMRIITGILEQSYGTIWINGMDTIKHREELQSLIGFLPQEFGTYENMTAWEFLDYQAIMKGLKEKAKRHERIEYVLKSVHLYDRKDHKIGSYSGGMKQRIGIALILLHLPRILVVDEPTAGLDPRERIRFRNLLVELSKDRIVIFSTHIIEDISSSCNQVVVINKGELKYFGDPLEMIDMAIGKVWNFLIDKQSFEEKLDKSLVVNNIQDGDKIQVRYLSKEQPYPGATQAEANLEDAYLCLLKNM